SFRKINLRKNMLDINLLSYFLPKVLRSLMKRKGMVFEADLDLIIDASGFSYSDQWPSKLRIYHLKNELNRCYRFRKPYIFLPQAFGPFTYEISRKQIAESFKHAAMICARDQRSLGNLEELTGSMDSLVLYGDFTNLTEGCVPSNFLDGAQQWACIVPNKNMVNARNSNQVWLQRYESLLKEVIEYYRERGLTPFFLNHEGDEDAALIDRVNHSLDSPIVVVTEPNPLIVKGIIGASRAVLCSRYHGCISALSRGIPCIGTSWSHKYELLYQQYNAQDLLLDPTISPEGLRLVLDLSLEVDSQVSKSIQSRALELKAQSAYMWDDFQLVVERYLLSRG
ncbi:MAG: polysaccharide pyruvyl transferase family protein, partial [Porticoccaceae bacterium]|nr:polysaccharide pyruvyl transferase family protein [Porticoccaceae bacterium]